MTLIGTAEPRNNSTLGGSHLAGFTASVVLGCALFIIDRKLAWGVDEPLLNASLLTFALFPHVLYAVLGSVIPSPPSGRDPALVRYFRFSAVWMVSLLAYAASNVATLSRWIDEPIYESLGLSLSSFALLAIIYVTASFAVVWVVAVLRRGKDRRDAGIDEAAHLGEMALGAAISLPIFFLLVLYLPVQY